jgi:aryl-alcohol dehydrogenase-like predicted oxidoreductase
MKYRDFGSTGMKISEIAFGAGTLSGANLIVQPDRQLCLAGVRRALDLGINWFDTAPSYGDAEERLGWALSELDATPQVSTKVAIGTEHLDDIAGEVERSVESSLKRLRRDHVDLIQLHSAVTEVRGTYGGGSITPGDVLEEGGVLTGFKRLRQRGLVRFFGLNGFGDVEALRTVMATGEFRGVQAYHNILNPSAGRPVPAGFSAPDYGNIIATARENGLGVLNIRVLAAGSVVGTAPHQTPYGTTSEADMRRGARVREVLGDDAGNMAQTGIRYVLMNPGVSAAEIGFARLEYIDEAVAAVDMGPLPDSTMQNLDPLYESDFA